MALDPSIRAELVELVREVVIQELRDFNAELWQGMDRALNEAFAPCVTLLKTVDQNQILVSDSQVAVEKAICEMQKAIFSKIGNPPDDNEPWRASLRDDDDDDL